MGIFGGGWGSKLAAAAGNIGGILQDVDNPSRSAERLQFDQQQFAGQSALKQQALQQQLAIAQAKLANGSQDPDVIRELRLSGIDPQSQQGQQAILGHLRPPQYVTLGNAETGQQVVQLGGAGGMAAPAPAAPAAPQIGAVMQGYRYNGGDPASQASWSKVP